MDPCQGPLSAPRKPARERETNVVVKGRLGRGVEDSTCSQFLVLTFSGSRFYLEICGQGTV